MHKVYGCVLGLSDHDFWGLKPQASYAKGPCALLTMKLHTAPITTRSCSTHNQDAHCTYNCCAHTLQKLVSEMFDAGFFSAAEEPKSLLPAMRVPEGLRQHKDINESTYKDTYKDAYKDTYKDTCKDIGPESLRQQRLETEATAVHWLMLENNTSASDPPQPAAASEHSSAAHQTYTESTLLLQQSAASSKKIQTYTEPESTHLQQSAGSSEKFALKHHKNVDDNDMLLPSTVPASWTAASSTVADASAANAVPSRVPHVLVQACIWMFKKTCDRGLL